MNFSDDKGTTFKKCPKCKFNWDLRDFFLSDPDIQLIGYQTNFKELTEGLFYFNHACQGTLTLYAREFADLYNGPIFKSRGEDSGECPGYCLYKKHLESCPVECECAYVREIVQIIKNWQKI